LCIGGKPELTFTPDTGEFPQGVREIDVAIKHTGSGAAISLTGGSIDPPGSFRIAAAPQWPVLLESGAEAHLTLRLTADAEAGDHVATLNVQASGCADQPLHLHAAIAASSPDAGSDPSGSVTSTGSSSASKAGGCSSSAAPTGILAILALAAALTARRRRR
jgi:MYXO-CTERM domain-containing protein